MVVDLLHKIQTITIIIPTSKTTKPPDIQKLNAFIYTFFEKHFICISYQSSTDAVTGKFQRYKYHESDFKYSW